MTRVCLVGSDDVNLRYELLSRETAREALATYDLGEPFENAVGVETVSLGAAVALLNDLDWYVVRFVEESMVFEPSVSETEWLSRDLATAVRDDEVTAEESDRFLTVYGLEPVEEGSDHAAGEPGSTGDSGDAGAIGRDDGATGGGESEPSGRSPALEDGRTVVGGTDRQYRLVEPMFVTRTGETLPRYDLRDVPATLIERVTESEFGA